MYKIFMGVLAKSHFKLPVVKCQKERLFVTGEKYDLKAKIKNIGTSPFPGGDLSLNILWSNGPRVLWEFPIQRLKPGDNVEVSYGTTDVLSDGPALFYANGTDSNKKSINFYNVRGNSLHTQPAGTHLYTIIPKNSEALYGLWALEVAVVALVILIIFQIVDWCIR